MTSASPLRIKLKASPMECAPVSTMESGLIIQPKPHKDSTLEKDGRKAFHSFTSIYLQLRLTDRARRSCQADHGALYLGEPRASSRWKRRRLGGDKPVVQAVETQWLGPNNPLCMETAPAAMFARILGTRNGLSLQKGLGFRALSIRAQRFCARCNHHRHAHMSKSGAGLLDSVQSLASTTTCTARRPTQECMTAQQRLGAPPVPMNIALRQ